MIPHGEFMLLPDGLHGCLVALPAHTWDRCTVRSYLSRRHWSTRRPSLVRGFYPRHLARTGMVQRQRLISAPSRHDKMTDRRHPYIVINTFAASCEGERGLPSVRRMHFPPRRLTRLATFARRAAIYLTQSL